MRLIRVVCLVVLSVVVTAPSRAQAERPMQLATEVSERPMLLQSEASERLLEEGRNHLLTFRLYDAERTFRRLVRRPDGTAAARYYLATASFFKALVTDEAVYFDEFFERSDSLRRALEAMPDSRWRAYLLAETYLQRAVAFVKTERFFRSALASRRAYRRFNDLIEEDTAFYEPYKGMGLMHLFIGTMPRAHRRLLKIFGYGGAVEQGMRELQQAAAYSQLNQEEAAIFRALADITLNNSASGGVETLERLHRAHPESALLAYLYGFALLSNRRAAEAERYLRAAVQAGASADYFYIDAAAFYLAQTLFRQNRFAEAESYYRHYVQRHRSEALKALAYYELGLTLEMQGRRDEAVSFYRQVNGARSYDSDRWAYRAAQKRLAAALSPRERQLLLGRNAYNAGHYDQAEALLGVVSEDAEASTGARVEAAYRLGRVYQAQGQLEQALRAHQYVVAHPVADPKARWAPWSQFYVGEIYAQRNDTLQATRAFEAALAYDTVYDYHRALEQQAKAALGRLGF